MEQPLILAGMYGRIISSEVMEMEQTMTGREIVNLITKLELEGMSADKIIEIIKYVETHTPAES